MWSEKDLEVKMKLRYYKEVNNPNLDDHIYLYILTSSKKKTNIAKIRTNSHEFHSETRIWTIPKTPWEEMIFGIVMHNTGGELMHNTSGKLKEVAPCCRKPFISFIIA